SRVRCGIAVSALVRGPVGAATYNGVAYEAVSGAVADFLHAEVYNGVDAAEIERLGSDVDAALDPEKEPDREPFTLDADAALVGVDPMVYRQVEAAVNSGKRHIIFYGPPGTGKTTLAEYAAREL